MEIFNTSLLYERRQRFADRFESVRFLKDEIAQRLVDRLLDVNRYFEKVADLGAYGNCLELALNQHSVAGQKIGHLQAMHEEQGVLPCQPEQFDALLSLFYLQWMNDLPRLLLQCRYALRPDGLFLAALPGPKTLIELRQAMQQVAGETGQATPRLAPMVEVRDAGALLQQAGFALPVVDSELISLTYRDFFTLLNEIRWMGEGNVLREQFKGLTTQHYWQQVEKAYARNAEGLLPLTVEVVYLTAWAPDASQQQPARRGSGKVSLKDWLK